MAKMFYTLAEAAERLGMSEDEVQGLTESGQLQEFRDRDQIMLKVEQVDLLSGADDDDDAGGEMIPLAESGELEPIGLSSSGSGSVFGAENPMEATGISIFDPEIGDEADPSAATQVAGGVSAPEFDMDAAASGTGMSGVSLEADDTSVGSDLLEDVYGSGAGQSAFGASGSMPAASGADLGASGVDGGGDLFESTGEEPDLTPAQPAAVGGMMMAEAYDGPGSGLVGGLALGMVLVLLAAATIVILALFGAAPTLIESVNMNVVYGIAGGGALFMIIAAVVGWVLLRRS
ncbi:MAG: helix-turn-helix domain-containing protein [Planctomycetota bacterium]